MLYTLLSVLLGLLVAARCHAQSNKIWFLTSPVSSKLDDGALREVVAIYTQDLHLQLETRPLAPGAITAQSLGEIAALVQSSAVRLAFWYQVRPEDQDVILYAIANSGNGPEVHALRVTGVERSELYRTLALKVRGVLTGTASLEPSIPTPTPELPPPIAPMQKTPPAVDSTPRAAAVSQPPDAHPEPLHPRQRPAVLIAVAYRLTLPIDTSLLRNGIALEAARPLGRHFELHLGFELTNQPEREIPGGLANLFDFPIRAGARASFGGSRLSVGFGPLVTLHILSISAIGFDQTRGSSVTTVAGLGGELTGQWRLTPHVALQLRFLCEAIVPPTRFLLHDTPAVETGGVLFGFGAGLSFAAP